MNVHRRTAFEAVLLLALAVAICACNSARRNGADPAATEPGMRTITVHGDQALGEIYPFWIVGNYNKPHALLEAGAIEELLEAAPLIKQINCVYLLGGRWEGQSRWFLGVAPDGSIRTDFSGMIAQLKVVLDAGFVPRIVLDDVPDDMSDPPQANVYGNTAPPKDERVWHQYVQAAVEAMVRAFGREKVGAWSFRVGTEPDLYPGHWAGTKEQYLAHYDYTVDAVRRVLPTARVGPGNILTPGVNPASRPANPRAAATRPGPPRVRWGLDIIDHCATGTNACTGGIGAPMDFFTCSWYMRVGRPISFFDETITAIRQRLDKYERFRNTPIEIGEFAVLGDERGKHLYAGETTEWSASFYAALADRVYALGVKQVFEWDEATFGVMHPRGRVIEMLGQMAGGQRLAVSVAATDSAECGTLACRQGDDLLLLVYNHRPERRPQIGERVRVVVRDRRMAAGRPWSLTEWTIDEKHASWAYAYEADCKAAGLEPLKVAGLYEGSPLRLYGEAGVEVFKKNAAKYAALSVVPRTKTDVPVKAADGAVTLDLDLAGHSVRLIRLSPPGSSAASRD